MIPLVSVARQTGWNTLPKMTSSLDTLTAAALASSSNQYNISAPVNPLAASHFGGTVGQSNLRPGTEDLVSPILATSTRSILQRKAGRFPLLMYGIRFYLLILPVAQVPMKLLQNICLSQADCCSVLAKPIGFVYLTMLIC